MTTGLSSVGFRTWVTLPLALLVLHLAATAIEPVRGALGHSHAARRAAGVVQWSLRSRLLLGERRVRIRDMVRAAGIVRVPDRGVDAAPGPHAQRRGLRAALARRRPPALRDRGQRSATCLDFGKRFRKPPLNPTEAIPWSASSVEFHLHLRIGLIEFTYR
jgi:hypothetical protein